MQEPTQLKVSPEDAALIEAVVYHEAGGEGAEGRNAVRAVIYNRLASPDFPNTVPGVLNQRNAFESVSRWGEGSAGGLLANTPPKVVEASLVEHGRFLKDATDPTGGAVYFQSTDPAAWEATGGTPYNQGQQPQAVIGNHAFYNHYEGRRATVVPYRVSLGGEPGGDVFTGRRGPAAQTPAPSGAMMAQRGPQRPLEARETPKGTPAPTGTPAGSDDPAPGLLQEKAATMEQARSDPQEMPLPLQARTQMAPLRPRQSQESPPRVPRPAPAGSGGARGLLRRG